MFGKKKKRISDLRQACLCAKLALDEASGKSHIAKSEVWSIAQDIKSVDEALYKRLLEVAVEMERASNTISCARGELHFVCGLTNE